MFSTVVGMANALIAQVGDPESATNIGALVPFFVMMSLAKGLVAATPLIVRGLSGNFMVVAGPAVAAGTAAISRGMLNTRGVQARERMGNLSSGEMAGRKIAQHAPAAKSAAMAAGGQIVRVAERARRLGK